MMLFGLPVALKPELPPSAPGLPAAAIGFAALLGRIAAPAEAVADVAAAKAEEPATPELGAVPVDFVPPIIAPPVPTADVPVSVFSGGSMRAAASAPVALSATVMPKGGRVVSDIAASTPAATAPAAVSRSMTPAAALAEVAPATTSPATGSQTAIPTAVAAKAGEASRVLARPSVPLPTPMAAPQPMAGGPDAVPTAAIVERRPASGVELAPASASPSAARPLRVAAAPLAPEIDIEGLTPAAGPIAPPSTPAAVPASVETPQTADRAASPVRDEAIVRQAAVAGTDSAETYVLAPTKRAQPNAAARGTMPTAEASAQSRAAVMPGGSIPAKEAAPMLTAMAEAAALSGALARSAGEPAVQAVSIAVPMARPAQMTPPEVQAASVVDGREMLAEVQVASMAPPVLPGRAMLAETPVQAAPVAALGVRPEQLMSTAEVSAAATIGRSDQVKLAEAPAEMSAAAATVRPDPMPIGIAPEIVATRAELTAAPVAATMPVATVPTASPAPLPEQMMRHQLDLAHDSAWLDQVARDIAVSAGNDARLRFQLNPEHLGSLQVEVTRAADGLAVRLTTESEAARGIVAEAQARLVAEARAQGTRILETHVELSSGGGGQGGTAGNAPGGGSQHPSGGQPAARTHASFGRGTGQAEERAPTARAAIHERFA